MQRFVYVRFTYNYNFPFNYELYTPEKMLFENNYYRIQENKGYYVITGVLWNENNPTVVIPKTKKLALHQLKTIANVFILQEYKRFIEELELPELQNWLKDEIKNYDPEDEPQHTNVPYILEQMHEKIKEWQELKRIVEETENRIQIIAAKEQKDDEEYWEYVVIV